MPRFFIDLHDEGDDACDEEGADFANAETARREAIQALTLMANDALPDGDRREFLVRVRDERGVSIFEAALSFKGDWVGGPRL